MDALRRRMTPAERVELKTLVTARAKLARLVTGGPRGEASDLYLKKVAELEDELRALEQSLGRRRPGLFVGEVTPSTVARAS